MSGSSALATAQERDSASRGHAGQAQAQAVGTGSSGTGATVSVGWGALGGKWHTCSSFFHFSLAGHLERRKVVEEIKRCVSLRHPKASRRRAGKRGEWLLVPIFCFALSSLLTFFGPFQVVAILGAVVERHMAPVIVMELVSEPPRRRPCRCRPTSLGLSSLSLVSLRLSLARSLMPPSRFPSLFSKRWSAGA